MSVCLRLHPGFSGQPTATTDDLLMPLLKSVATGQQLDKSVSSLPRRNQRKTPLVSKKHTGSHFFTASSCRVLLPEPRPAGAGLPPEPCPKDTLRIASCILSKLCPRLLQKLSCWSAVTSMLLKPVEMLGLIFLEAALDHGLPRLSCPRSALTTYLCVLISSQASTSSS
ncbi:uncharacterized protein LOC134728794 isoform X2 [Pan paniscus]|uniref:uncharacterized protein LOC134728794 isoform X2 n=1 Tax=Pan paniscus TaxID=9597 RepID=UPI001560E1B3